jgi:hypothetical protein
MLPTKTTLDKFWLCVPALYVDARVARVLVRFGRWQEPVEISQESGRKILAAAIDAEAIADEEGYEEDCTARIYWLSPDNQFVNLMTKDERTAVWREYEFMKGSGRGGRIVRARRLGRRPQRTG